MRKIPDRTSKEADIHIGLKIKEYRLLNNLSQERLADMMGVTFQQIQKYEKGANRISGGRMWQLCQILRIMPNDLFPKPGKHKQAPLIEDQDIRLIRAFNQIKPKAYQQKIYKFIKSLGGIKA